VRQSSGAKEGQAKSQGKKSVERVLELVVSRKRSFVPAMDSDALKQGRFSVGGGFEVVVSCSVVGARLLLDSS
jgi:hypothetical protein